MIYQNLTPDQITQLEFQAGKEATRLLDKLNGMTDSSETNTEFAGKEIGSTSLPAGFTVTNGYLKNMSVSGSGNLAGTSSDSNKCFSYLATEDMDVWLDMIYGSSQQIAVFEGEKYGSSYLVGNVYASNTADYPMPTAQNPLHVAAGQYITFSYYNSSTAYENISWKLYNVKPNAGLNSALGLTTTMKEEVVEMSFSETVSGSTPEIAAMPGKRYICGEVSTLSFTPSAKGICEVIFTSGSTPTVLTVPNTVKWPAWFDPTDLDASTVYELSVSDGVYGAVGVWS